MFAIFPQFIQNGKRPNKRACKYQCSVKFSDLNSLFFFQMVSLFTGYWKWKSTQKLTSSACVNKKETIIATETQDGARELRRNKLLHAV